MTKNSPTFWSTRPSNLEHDIEHLCRHLTCTIREFSASEAEAFHAEAFDHLVALRELEEKFEKIYLARHEAERVAELAQREQVTLETVDGEKLNFDAPYGFDGTGRTIYSYDICDLAIEDGKVTAARAYVMGHYFPLTPEELDKCNSLLVRM